MGFVKATVPPSLLPARTLAAICHDREVTERCSTGLSSPALNIFSLSFFTLLPLSASLASFSRLCRFMLVVSSWCSYTSDAPQYSSGQKYYRFANPVLCPRYAGETRDIVQETNRTTSRYR